MIVYRGERRGRREKMKFYRKLSAFSATSAVKTHIQVFLKSSGAFHDALAQQTGGPEDQHHNKHEEGKDILIMTAEKTPR